METIRAFGGMVAAPHALASQAGARVLAEGGNAIEAMVAVREIISHAGAVVHHPCGLMEGASDPRSDDRAVGL